MRGFFLLALLLLSACSLSGLTSGSTGGGGAAGGGGLTTTTTTGGGDAGAGGAGGSLTTYAAMVIADGAIAYWPMDEVVQAPQVIPPVHGASSLTVAGTSSDASLLAAGVLGPAVRLTQQTYLQLTQPGALTFSESDFSVEAWVNRGPICKMNQRGIVSRFDQAATPATGFSLSYVENACEPSIDVAFVVLHAGDITTLTGSYASSLAEGWVHLVATYSEASNPPRATLFINGELADGPKGIDGGLTPTDDASDFRVGARFADNSPLDASLDEVAVYDTALTQAQVRAHYEALVPPQ